MFYFFIFLLFLPVTLFLPTKVIGKTKSKFKNGGILVCNHYSNFDAPLLDIKIGKRIRFLAKKELVSNKLKKYIFQDVLGSIPVDRGTTDIKATREVLTLLKNKELVGIFPEGTRNKNEEEKLEVKNGACVFAIKSRVPIIPAWIVKKPKVFRRNTILIGEPFELSEFYNKKLDKETISKAGEILTEKMLELKSAYEEYQLEKKTIKKIKKAQKNTKK